MAQDYYLGNGRMMNYGIEYQMEKEELIKWLDMYVEIAKEYRKEKDELQKELFKLKYKESLNVSDTGCI